MAVQMVQYMDLRQTINVDPPTFTIIQYQVSSDWQIGTMSYDELTDWFKNSVSHWLMRKL